MLTEAQGRALGDQTRILLRASRSLAWGTPAQVEVGNSTGEPGVRACASWLSPLSRTASQPQRPQLGRIRSLLCAFTPSSVARVRSTRISIAHTSASKTYPENLPRTKVERASPRDLDAQTGATLQAGCQSGLIWPNVLGSLCSAWECVNAGGQISPRNVCTCAAPFLPFSLKADAGK